MENKTIELYVEREMYASGWQRLGNYIIDLIAIYIIVILIGLVIDVIYFLGIEGPAIWLAGIDDKKANLLGILSILLYYFIFESLGQRTIGKLITGTKVVMKDGNKPGVGTIALRCLCRLIPFDAFSCISERSRGWHDSIAQSYVIDVKRYKEAYMMKASVEEIGTE